MRVLFLDFDGVINNSRTWSEFNRESDGVFVIPTAPECIERLNRLIAETGARVVISSSWRNFASWDNLAPALAARGFVGEVIGETPNLVNEPVWLERWRTREGAPFTYERMERGWEIREWIAAHPDVTEFAILDDCSDMAELKPWLVHTDAEIGLDDPDVERAKWLLDNSAKGVELARSLAIGGVCGAERCEVCKAITRTKRR